MDAPSAGARRWRLRLPLLAGLAAGGPGRLASAPTTLASLAALAMPAAPSHAAGDLPPVQGGGPDVSRLPAPGSYTLQRLFTAPDGEVLLPDGRPMRLHRILDGRLSVVSFIYSYCREPEGCPLAWRVLDAVHAALRDDGALSRRAQLVTISFDPTNDTPEQMRLLGGPRIGDRRLRWWFLTTASVSRLLPLLDGFGQDVTVELDDQGRPTRTLNHLLKLFVVDGMRQVREVYGVATLAPEALVNDLRTLALAADGA